jgi:hypothetical protein
MDLLFVHSTLVDSPSLVSLSPPGLYPWSHSRSLLSLLPSSKAILEVYLLEIFEKLYYAVLDLGHSSGAARRRYCGCLRAGEVSWMFFDEKDVELKLSHNSMTPISMLRYSNGHEVTSEAFITNTARMSGLWQQLDGCL